MSSATNDSIFNSTTLSPFDSTDDKAVISVKDYVKELLKSRIFLGRYVERRLVNKNLGYRDIVVLSPAELDLKRDLLEAQHQLASLNKFQWIGITDTELLENISPGLCLWTEIDNQPFGPFWFQIKTVQVRNEEVMVKLRCLRHINDAFLEVEPILTGGGERSRRAKENTTIKTEINKEALSETYTDIKETLKTALTISNVKEFITFVVAFVIAVFTGSSAFINFLGTFVLALVRETSILIKNSTPMFLGFLDFLSKIVGGFYILLAMFFRPNKPPPSDRRRLSYYDGPVNPNLID